MTTRINGLTTSCCELVSYMGGRMRSWTFRVPVALLLAVAVSPAFAQTPAKEGGTPNRVTSTAAASSNRQPATDQPTSGSVPAAAAPTALHRGYFSVNAGYQGATNNFTSAWSLPCYLEAESVNVGYSVKPGVLIDVGGGVRVWRGLTVGVAVSRYNRADLASLSASVPHPLYYDQPRSFQGTAAGPQRTETAVHVQAMWVFAAARKIQVGVFGGPSLFSVKQVFIWSVNFADVYPYDTVTVSNTPTESQFASKTGFNVGGDVTYLVYKQIGVGGLVRFSGVRVGFKTQDGTALSLKAGGLQVGAGFRVRF
jgi:hypothetical protein